MSNEYGIEPVDAKELEAAVRARAEANPDFTYMPETVLLGCQYTHADDKPGCIVGGALADLGRPIPYESPLNTSKDVDDLWRLGIIEGDPSWLSSVQAEQDAGVPWGEAIKSVDNPDEPAWEDDEYEADYDY